MYDKDNLDPKDSNNLSDEGEGYSADADSEYFDPFEEDRLDFLGDAVETNEDHEKYTQQKKLFKDLLEKHQVKEKQSAAEKTLQSKVDESILRQQLETVKQLILIVDEHKSGVLESNLPQNIKNKLSDESFDLVLSSLEKLKANLVNAIAVFIEFQFKKLGQTKIDTNHIDEVKRRINDYQKIKKEYLGLDLIVEGEQVKSQIRNLEKILDALILATEKEKNQTLMKQLERETEEKAKITIVKKWFDNESYARQLVRVQHKTNQSAIYNLKALSGDDAENLSNKIQFLQNNAEKIRFYEDRLLYILHHGLKTKEIKKIITEIYTNPEGERQKILLNLIEQDSRFEMIKIKVCHKLKKLTQKIEVPCQYYINYLETEINRKPSDLAILQSKKKNIAEIKNEIKKTQTNLNSNLNVIDLKKTFNSIRDTFNKLESDDIKKNLCKKRIGVFDKLFANLICWIDGENTSKVRNINDLFSSDSSEGENSHTSVDNQHSNMAPENDVERILEEAKKKHSTLYGCYNFFKSIARGEKAVKEIEGIMEKEGLKSTSIKPSSS